MCAILDINCATWPCDVIRYMLVVLDLLRVCVYVYIYVQYDIKYFV